MRTVEIRTQRQQNHNWCWAAVGSMIYEHVLGVQVSQCQLAAGLTKRSCCEDSSLCDRAESLAVLLRSLGCLRGGAPVSGPLSLSAIKREIDRNGYVVPVRIAGGSQDGAHIVMILGYDSTTSRDYIAVFDPLRGKKLVRFETFPANVVPGSIWTHSYLLQVPS